MRTRKEREGLPILLIFLLLNSFTIGVYAHGGNGDGHDGEPEMEAQNYYGTAAAMSPFTYLGDGDYLTAFFVCVLWAGIIGGLYNLSLMLLARLTTKIK